MIYMNMTALHIIKMCIRDRLAVAALQQYLVKTKKRTSLSLILESGEPREVHHFATPVSYTHLMKTTRY